ncbi:hypothetical protein [Anatilimnocola floriformis]|uniref:hypothetical protein n=1 Tax=Anatilimnocola floriformis TaxID=2948575 RepID=UPI0020C22433|nr:hypothetical protein [Anatilimnocola floriformis]
MTAPLRVRLVGCFLLGSLLLSVPSFAAEKTARDLLPATVIGYAELPQPGKLIDLFVDHPLSKQLQALPEYQQAMQRPEYQKGLEALAAIEKGLGEKLRPAAGKLTSGGAYFGFDLASQGVVLLIKSSDAALADKALDTSLELARAAAKEQGNGDPVKSGEFRGIKTQQIGDLRLAVRDGWMIAANKSLTLSFVLNNLLDEKPESLAGEMQFQTAYAKRSPTACLWSYIDLRLLRSTGILKTLASQKSDNPAGELLAGGIVTALPDAPYVTATLEADQQRFALSLAMPCDTAAAAKKKEFYFGVAGQGQSPPLLEPKHTLFTLSTYRDFGSLWKNAPDLFNDEINAKFVEAEGGLKTLFAGRDFRDEILGNLLPGMQIVAVRQQYKAGDVIPAIKLPAIALVMQMKNPETSRIFKVTFQSFIGFINIAGGQNGIDPLDLNSEKIGNALVVSAEYLPPEDEKTKLAAPPQFNASPTAAFVGDKFILSSAKPLAIELLDLVPNAPATPTGTNTAIKIDGQVVQAALDDNRESLITQNMLERGHDRDAAEKQVTGLLAAGKQIAGTTLKLMQNAGELRLDWEIKLSK